MEDTIICNDCGWTGSPDELAYASHCPNCLSADIEDIDIDDI